MSIIKNLLSSTAFFRDKNIDVKNEYSNDPYPKCFLVTSVDDGTRFKVRISLNESESTVKKELRVLQYLRENNVKSIPNIYDYSLSKGSHILICEYFDGMSLEKFDDLTKKELKVIRADLLTIISEFRTLEHHHCKSYSQIYSSWYDYFICKMQEHISSKENEVVFSPKEILTIQQICRSFEKEMKAKKNFFIHYDIKPKNIVYNRANQKAYLIDYELGRFGDNLMELARLRSFCDDRNYLDEIVNPIIEHFGVNRMLGKNLFTLYLLYCHIVFHRYYYAVFLDTRSLYHFGEAERYKKESRNHFLFLCEQVNQI